MNHMKEFSALTIAQLQELLLNMRKEQFNLRMQNAVGQNSKPHLHKTVRRNIARIKMLIGKQKVQPNE